MAAAIMSLLAVLSAIACAIATRISVAAPNLIDIEAWKRRLEGGEPEEWCHGVQCDVCGSSFLVRVIRVHRHFSDVYYAVCVYCLAVRIGIAR